MGTSSGGRYRGPDRREGEDETIVARRYAGLSWLALALLLVAGATVALALTVGPRPEGLRTPLFAAALAAAVMLAVVSALYWRSTGRVRGCRLATAAWLLAGTMGLDVAARSGQQLPAGLRQVLLAVALGWLLWAVTGPDVDTRVRPVRDLALGGAVVVLGLGGVVLAHRLGPLPVPGHADHLALGGVAIAVMAVIARRRRRGDLVLLDVASLMAVTLGATELSRAATATVPAVPWEMLAAGVPPLGLLAAAIGTAGWLSVGLTARRADLHAAQLAQQSHHLEQQRRSREEGHEIENAVLAIEGAVLVLERNRDALDAEDRRQLSEGLVGRLEQLRRLVTSRPTGPAPVSLWDLVSRQAVIARAQGMPAALEGDPEVVVLGDADRIVQVVDNLLVNARRHGRGEEHGVTLAIGREDGQGVLRVRDRGPGVPAERREAVFEAGAQGPGSRGDGLGLHLARKLAREQGGDLGLERRPAGGAGFVLVLPLALPPAGASDGVQDGVEVSQPPAAPVSRMGGSASRRAGMVVEDDDEVGGGRLDVGGDDRDVEAAARGGRREQERDPRVGRQQ